MESMKPKFKAPGTKRLKLKNGNMLTNFAFNSNLRRYTLVGMGGLKPLAAALGPAIAPLLGSLLEAAGGSLWARLGQPMVGQRRLNRWNPRWRRLKLSP
jgi:hypothetical protein